MGSRSRALVPFALLVIVGTRYATLAGAYPSGYDNISMLLFGARVVAAPDVSEGVRGDVLIPLLLTVLASFIGPMGAIHAVGLASVLALALALYLFSRRALPPAASLAAALLSLSSRVVSEPTIGGAYQQNVAFAGLIGTVVLAAECAKTGSRRSGAAFGICLFFVVICHWAYAAIALAGVAAVAAGAAVSTGAPVSYRLMLLSAAPAAIAWTGATVFLFSTGYSLPNEWTGGFAEIWEYSLRGPLWGVAAIVGIVALSLPLPRLERVRVPALSLLAAGAVAAFIVPHPRVMPPVVVAAMVGLCVLAEAIVERSGSRLRKATIALVLGGLGGALLFRGDSDMKGMREWYRAMDADLADAAGWVSQHGAADSRLAVNAGPMGRPVGLWFAALTSVPTLVGSDPALLAFPKLREQAGRVASLFDPAAAWDEVSRRARAAGVDLLVSEKASAPRWREWVDAAGPAAREVGRFVAFRTGADSKISAGSSN